MGLMAIVSLSYLIIIQLFLQSTFIHSTEARMGLMTKLKILALLALAKKVDVVPFPLPIPIPIHIQGKEEFVYMDSIPKIIHSRPYAVGPPFYVSNIRPYYSRYSGYSASELSPVSVLPDTRPLRYGDRISGQANKSPNESADSGTTYRIRKVNRNQSTETSTSASIKETITNDHKNDGIDLKDIKIIFIPIKNLSGQKNQNNEIQSNMKQFSEEVSKHLIENTENNNNNKSNIMEPDKSLENPTGNIMDGWKAITTINNQSIENNKYTAEQTSPETKLPTKIMVESAKPTKMDPSTFAIPSLQTQWLQQNSYVPRAQYYKPPELKVIHRLKSQNESDFMGNQWSVQNPVPSSSPPKHIQFLYSISHNNNNDQPSYMMNQSPASFRYPIVENFGLETFRQSQYHRKPLMEEKGPLSAAATSSMLSSWMQSEYPFSPLSSSTSLLNRFNQRLAMLGISSNY